jgi:hypothetical protein|uniref:Uncharacterized protein n=1 Tax=viral metagenome TaxID=1070528 RepID=A0A6C0CUV2_9ZZZZ
MNSSYISVFVFIIITIIYYTILKPKLTYEKLKSAESNDEMSTYSSSSNTALIIYMILVLISQLVINIGYIINTCGGDIASNIGAGFLITLIPWVFIFGLLVSMLIIFPGFKSAFSNVIGYFCVYGSANDILTQLLINPDIENTMKQDNLSEGDKKKYQSVADAIIKICGNTSIIINQIVPENFLESLATLSPLMKPEYQQDNPDSIELKQKLLNTVLIRDNIGEALWYVNTAILVTSVVQYNIAMRGCNKDLKSIQEQQANFEKKQETIQNNNKKATSTTYTMS